MVCLQLFLSASINIPHCINTTRIRNTCMQQPLALLTKNAIIFGEHEVFVDCCHSNTAIYIFLYFFQKKLKKVCK